jgi:hypothetical protein
MSASDKMALIIGMDRFQNPILAPLDSCKIDAQGMFETLSKLGYAIFGNSPLIGSNLDKEYGSSQIRKSIVTFFGSATADQTLLFYFSGHGIAWADDVFLSTPQVDPLQPMAEGFAFSDLTKLMSQCKSKRIVGIIDACSAGAIDLPGSVLKDSPESHANQTLAAYDKICDNVPKAEGINLLLSSQAYAPSAAGAKDDNSLYTKYLIEGLRGIKPESNPQGKKIPYSGTVNDDGNITPLLLHQYVYHKVANQTNQLPKIKVDESSEIVIASYPDLASASKSEDADNNKILFAKGIDFLSKKDYNNALDNLEKVVQAQPNYAAGWRAKGFAYFGLKKYDEAIQCFEEFLKIQPDDELILKGKNYARHALWVINNI